MDDIISIKYFKRIFFYSFFLISSFLRLLLHFSITVSIPSLSISCYFSALPDNLGFWFAIYVSIDRFPQERTMHYIEIHAIHIDIMYNSLLSPVLKTIYVNRYTFLWTISWRNKGENGTPQRHLFCSIYLTLLYIFSFIAINSIVTYC